MNNGLLISFEGLDKCGKTTQLKKLYTYLIGKNYPVSKYSSLIGDDVVTSIGNIILDKKNILDPITELLLYEAARREAVVKYIKPDIQEGKIVLLDRYIDSSIAYQGGLRKVNCDFINYLNEAVVENLKPNIVFLIKVCKQTYIERIKDTLINDLDRIELDSMNNYHLIDNAYKFLEYTNEKIISIKEDTEENMFKEILTHLKFLE